MRKFLLPLACVALSFPALATAAIEIDHSRSACVDGWITMNVDVRVDGESFNFSPSCSFSFNDTIVRSNGSTCRVSAGMCSGFSPEKKFEVACDAGTESVDIDCPAE